MSDDFEHGLTVTIPPRFQSVSLSALRQLREEHRARGGTSKLTRDGDRFRLTARGPVDAVLATTAAVAKIGESIKAADEKVRATLRGALDRMGEREQARKEAFIASVSDAFQNMPRKT